MVANKASAGEAAGPVPEPGYSAFISHASADREMASRICANLEAAGFRCWIAPRDVRPGQDYPSEIINGIVSSKALVLVLSDNANRSTFVQAEVERACSKGKPIFPIRIEEVLPARSLELFISTKHWIDAWEGNLSSHSSTLARMLQEDADVAITVRGPRGSLQLGRWAQLGILAVIAAGIAWLATYYLRPDPMSGPDYSYVERGGRVQFLGSMVGNYYPLEATFFLSDAYGPDGKRIGGIRNMRHFEVHEVEDAQKPKLLYKADPKEFADEYDRTQRRTIPLDNVPKRIVSCFSYHSADKTMSHVVIEGFNFHKPSSRAATFPVTPAGPREIDIKPRNGDCRPYVEAYAAKHMKGSAPQ